MPRDADLRCAAIAGSQFGVISRVQALEAGMTARMIRYRLKNGWTVAMPCVYTLPGSIDGWGQKLKAAQLWAGDGSAVHRRSAAVIYEISGATARHIEIVGQTRKRTYEGVTYTCSSLSRHDVRPYRGFIVTSVERTLIDLASVWSQEQLAIGLDDVLRRRLTVASRISRRLEDLGSEGRKGSGVIRELLGERHGLDEFPESRLETRSSGVGAPLWTSVASDSEAVHDERGPGSPDGRLLP
jgi:hypothetical protein